MGSGFLTLRDPGCIASSAQPDALVTNLAWSWDSEYILAALPKRGVVNVYMMRDDQWTARIEAGTEGLTKAEWAPDGRTILCFSEWGVRLATACTLYSII